MVLLAISFLLLLFQCVCSLLHINKIFEVGISEHLANKLQHMNIDLVEKVVVSLRVM
jgi:DNA mismatch repair protein MSH5